MVVITMGPHAGPSFFLFLFRRKSSWQLEGSLSLQDLSKVLQREEVLQLGLMISVPRLLPLEEKR